MRVRLPYRFVGSFKGLLFVLAIAIIIGSMVYTETIVSELRENTRELLSTKVDRMQLLLRLGEDESLEAYLSEMATKDFPLIVANWDDVPVSWSGLGDLDMDTTKTGLAKVKSFQEKWQNQGNDPVPVEIAEHGLTYYYYYGDSAQIRRFRRMLWVEIGMVSGLILIGYLGFVNIKKSEERSVWVGMARETAHQLGTPLTSLYGWVELLRDKPDDPSIREEILADLERLQTVADRFNRIGSTAKLEQKPLTPLVKESGDYIRRRLPKGQKTEVILEIDIPAAIEVQMNGILLGWVFENLMKNGVESLQGQGGKVTVNIGENGGGRVSVDVTDEGSGITRSNWRNVFRPGYTTKKRGWGLGLSLSKRIVEDVHKGKIFVLQSVLDKGTTIRVQLPV